MGLGITEYFSDVTNYLDLLVVGCGLIDIEIRNYYPSSNGSTSNSAIKSIKIFRVLRIMRLSRNMKTMRRIMTGIYDSLLKILYVLILLVVFILIYMILGMSLLKEDSLFSKHLNAFYIVFQILTVENWNSILYELQ